MMKVSDTSSHTTLNQVNFNWDRSLAVVEVCTSMDKHLHNVGDESGVWNDKTGGYSYVLVLVIFYTQFFWINMPRLMLHSPP